ncbi:hypothetical protein [Zunongwangia endophytica]|uniref:Uncharacterized protein n=1 Tax=Zunongwangia endophytica TaxID=1808945 RepID=A0ABV8HC39_9FLAO|nr:hypothetical protein [Zunongwangia endophytica]MDN3596339.1 hypothetical protein [Zunongwangia endophytica]
MKYESLFLISEKEKNNQITIHGGTLFDYYFTLNKNSSAKERKNLILSEYLKGLLHILDSHKDNLSLEIIGSTYILNQRTAEKMGFDVRKTNMVQLIILILNYPNLICTKSFASKKLSFPNLKEIRTYKANIQSLNNSAATIRKIQNALERNLSYQNS